MTRKYLYDWQDETAGWCICSLNSVETELASWIVSLEDRHFVVWQFIGQGLFDEKAFFSNLDEAKECGRQLAVNQGFRLISPKNKSLK